MRRCSQSSVNKLMHIKPPTVRKHGSAIVTAYWDAIHEQPMSKGRELRLLEALGIDPPRRKQYWRPCLPVELTPEQRKSVLAHVNRLLATGAPTHTAARVGARGDTQP